ncbi:BTB/POZ domain-containing protein FBL11 isoform X2 [Bidens hawaiensis]|uniref:BTB/POZ domain-containing protein FBL11 isoform X2 n=1 Tax=Bidens hawaiensis TaxID=980011 RepID=UPI0040499992
MAVDDGDEFVVLKCIDHQQQADGNNPINIIIISTTDVSTWNFSSILQHPIIKVKAQTNRDPDVEVLVLWNRSTFLRLLASLFASPLVITSENFLSLFEGALYFGMEMILSHCKTWLTNALSDAAGVPLLQLTDLVSIWDFGSQLLDYLRELCTSYLAKNFIWAISCRSFVDVPYDLLLFTINHPHLTVDSEKQLCDHLLVWIAANKERCTEDAYITLLKQIRISLLPLWFAAGKSTYRFLSMCFNGSSCGALTLLKQPLTCLMDGHGDNELLNLKIRLTEFTQRVDLAGCSQITPAILLLSMLPSSLITEPALRNKIVQLLINHEPLSKNSFKSSCEMWSKLTFEAVHEMDISNCPMLHLENVVECFSKSFPSLRKFKAAYYLRFRTRKLLKLLVDKCPLICDIDLTVDVTPVVMTEMPSVASSVGSVRSPLPVLGSKPLSSNVTKLILEGRIDVTDFDLQSISEICFSLTYINLKGCILVSDAGISSLICRCLKLNSIVACDTYFGQQSILALCSLNARCDDVLAEHSMQSIPQGSNIQMLHMGGCKGINTTYFLNLMSHARMLKNLCLRDTEVVDDCLFNFCGSSLEVLDVSNTKVSTAALAHVIGHNPSLKCLKTRGCKNLLQLGSKNIFMDLGKLCKLDEISVGWGFSYLSLEPLKPAISLLKVIEVGLGGFLGLDGLPVTCPLLESVVLYFQVISDDVIVNMLESLQHLTSLALCHCLGEISSLSFKVSMPNLRKLKLERVAPWMSNGDMISLSQSCVNLIELSLLGCRLLNSEAQKIISSGWPGLISVHLEECGQVTLGGVDSLFDCQALEDVLLRHNGSGIQKGFIGEAVTKLPMLRKLSLDMCDAKDREFDIPELDDWCFLSYVKIARCKSLTVGASVHRETLVLMWDSKQMIRTLVKERI